MRVAAMDDVPMAIPHLVAVELLVRMAVPVAILPLVVFSAVRKCTVITVMRIVEIIDVTVPAARTVEPGSGADEDTVVEPFGTVVAPWCAGVRRIGKVSVRTNGRRTDLYGNLGLGARRGCEQETYRERNRKKHRGTQPA